MFPRLFELGPITVYSYGVLLASAYLLALYYSVRRARRFGLDGNRVLDLGIYIIISALIGAKLLLLIVDFDYFRRQPAELWTLARSGGVFYGGLVLAFAVAFWYVRKHRLPVWPVAASRSNRRDRVPPRPPISPLPRRPCPTLSPDWNNPQKS